MGIDIEQIRLIIADYKLDYEPGEYTYRRRAMFAVYSYAEWACDALLGYIYKHWGKADVIDVIIDFKHKMRACRQAALGHDPTKAVIFITAIDVASDIEDILVEARYQTLKQEMDERYEYLVSED